MKINRLLALMAIAALFLSASAIVPKTEVNTRYSKVTNVERTDTSLRVGVRLQNYPNYWVKIPASTRLIAVDDTTLQYRIIGSENLPLGQEIWMPASGHHDGTLIFEKVPDTVKIVDMVESDPADIKNNILGIHLDEAETSVSPKLITADDIMNGKNTISEGWSGLDPKRYTDMSFYKKDGKTHLQCKIADYSPRCGVSTFSIRTIDDFTVSNKVTVGNINPNGSFEIEIPVTYPQFSYFQLGDIHKDLFLIPGDTLSIVTSMSRRMDPTKGYIPEYFGFEGEPDDAVVVNLLADSLINKRYSLDHLYGKYYVVESDSMKLETYKANTRLGELLDNVVSDLPVLLGDVTISGFAKDILSALAISEICMTMEDLEQNFTLSHGPSIKQDEYGNYSYHPGERLELAELLSPRLKHVDLVYNNPLLFCAGDILPNRWALCSLFHEARWAALGCIEIPGRGAYQEVDDLKEPYKISENILDSIGVGNCFVAQFVRSNSFIESLKTIGTPSYSRLERNNMLMSQLIKHNESDIMNDILMAEYCNYVKDVMIAENAINVQNDAIILDGTTEGEVLEKIISPYRGNFLFLDFWGISCGPCRTGMVKQKPLLEQFADMPFKALYIANADDGLEACKKWLRNEGIKGEHIFVTNDDWNRLCGIFNITGIPHGVLIDKDGKIINSNYDASLDGMKDYPELRKFMEE